ncbi:MAG: GerMN domain-containing protein [bacterium]
MRYWLTIVFGLVFLALVAAGAYWLNNKDQPGPKVQKPMAQMVFVYFVKPTETDMDWVAVERGIPVSDKVEDSMLDTLKLLVQGPTQAEIDLGLSAPFNEGTQVNSVQFDDDILIIDFNDKFDRQMGGSMRVRAISGMIDETVRQFPIEGVAHIELTINNGEREAVLEP